MLSGFQPLLLVLWKCQLTAQLWNVQDIAFGNHTLLTRTMAPLKYVLRWRIGQKDLKPPVRLRSGFSRLTGEFVHLWLDRIHPIPPAAASAWPGDVFFLVSGLPSGFLALSWLASHLSHCCPVLCSVHPIGDWRGGGGSVEPSRVGGLSNLSKHPRRRHLDRPIWANILVGEPEWHLAAEKSITSHVDTLQAELKHQTC